MCVTLCVCESLDDSITFISLIETKNQLIVIELGLKQRLQLCLLKKLVVNQNHNHEQNKCAENKNKEMLLK